MPYCSSKANTATWTAKGGQITHADATLTHNFTHVGRDGSELHAQATIPGRGDHDHAGHILAHRFLLDQGPTNLFPQHAHFNTSAYKPMENEWAAWTDHGGTVNTSIDFGFHNGPERPTHVNVDFRVEDQQGDNVRKHDPKFLNEPDQEFDRVPLRYIRRIMSQQG